jgi:hypothetical protein
MSLTSNFAYVLVVSVQRYGLDASIQLSFPRDYLAKQLIFSIPGSPGMLHCSIDKTARVIRK